MRLNVRVVRNVLQTARDRPPLSKKTSHRMLEACHASLKAHARGELTLDPEVRTSLRVVVLNIWQVRHHAAAQLRAHQSPYSDSTP